LGTDYLRALSRRITPAADADYMISTVHRAKGLEWKRVKVANDFRFRMIDGRLMLDEDEMRLLYVAVTRAQHVMDISEFRDELLQLLAARPVTSKLDEPLQRSKPASRHRSIARLLIASWRARYRLQRPHASKLTQELVANVPAGSISGLPSPIR
jgi:superfamily I DNA/RNA helicase